MRCKAGSPLLHCDSILHQTEENRINNKPPRGVQVAPHVGWVIDYSNLLGTRFDIHEMIARPSFLFSVSRPFLSEPQLSRPSCCDSSYRCLTVSHNRYLSAWWKIGCSSPWAHDRARYLGFLGVDCGRCPPDVMSLHLKCFTIILLGSKDETGDTLRLLLQSANPHEMTRINNATVHFSVLSDFPSLCCDAVICQKRQKREVFSV